MAPLCLRNDSSRDTDLINGGSQRLDEIGLDRCNGRIGILCGGTLSSSDPAVSVALDTASWTPTWTHDTAGGPNQPTVADEFLVVTGDHGNVIAPETFTGDPQ